MKKIPISCWLTLFVSFTFLFNACSTSTQNSGATSIIQVTATPTLTPLTQTVRPTVLPTLTPTPQQESIRETPQQTSEVNRIISPEAIKDFLVEKVGVTAFGGKVFCAYQVMGIEQESQVIKIYLWAFLQEYLVEQQSLVEGTGTSEPIVIFVKMQNGKYEIFDYKDAGEGYQYLTQNFPPGILPLINLPADEYNQRSASLSNETRNEAETYFGVH